MTISDNSHQSTTPLDSGGSLMGSDQMWEVLMRAKVDEVAERLRGIVAENPSELGFMLRELAWVIVCRTEGNLDAIEKELDIILRRSDDD